MNDRSKRLAEVCISELRRMMGFVKDDLRARFSPDEIGSVSLVDSPFPPKIEVAAYGDRSYIEPKISGIARERCLRVTRVRGPETGAQVYRLRFKNNGKYIA